MAAVPSPWAVTDVVLVVKPDWLVPSVQKIKMAIQLCLMSGHVCGRECGYLPSVSAGVWGPQCADSQAECGRSSLGLVASRRAPSQERGPRGTQVCDVATGCTRHRGCAAALRCSRAVPSSWPSVLLPLAPRPWSSGGPGLLRDWGTQSGQGSGRGGRAPFLQDLLQEAGDRRGRAGRVWVAL